MLINDDDDGDGSFHLLICTYLITISIHDNLLSTFHVLVIGDTEH